MMDYLLLSEHELEIIDLFAEISNLIHISVESCSLLELCANLIIREMSVSALSDMDLIGNTLVITVLSLEVVKLLTEFSDEGILLRALNFNRFVSSSL